MTREDRWIVSLDEIRGVRWECQHCHAAMTYALDQTIRLPENCPSCNTDLFDTFRRPGDHAYADFINALKGIVQQQKSERPAVRFRLEFSGEIAAKG